jgi:hypothetical protein
MSDTFRAHNIPPKLVENRDWTTNYRGSLLIHASRTFEQEVLDAYTSRFPHLADCIPLDEKDYVKGAILGIAELVYIVEAASDPWFRGRYGWLLVNARLFEHPIDYRGQLHLFDVPGSVVNDARPSGLHTTKSVTRGVQNTLGVLPSFPVLSVGKEAADGNL